jgi:hypothetical protein
LLKEKWALMNFAGSAGKESVAHLRHKQRVLPGTGGLICLEQRTAEVVGLES